MRGVGLPRSCVNGQEADGLTPRVLYTPFPLIVVSKCVVVDVYFPLPQM